MVKTGMAGGATLRFLAAPSDVNWGGKVHGGTVMRWIDEAAYVCAAGWNRGPTIAVYAGGVRFYRPLLIGSVVEVRARLVHTGRHSMHISVHVRSGDPKTDERELTTHSMMIFVALDEERRSALVQQWVPVSDEDVALDAHAAPDQLRARADLRTEPPAPSVAVSAAVDVVAVPATRRAGRPRGSRVTPNDHDAPVDERFTGAGTTTAPRSGCGAARRTRSSSRNADLEPARRRRRCGRAATPTGSRPVAGRNGTGRLDRGAAAGVPRTRRPTSRTGSAGSSRFPTRAGHEVFDLVSASSALPERATAGVARLAAAAALGGRRRRRSRRGPVGAATPSVAAGISGSAVSGPATPADATENASMPSCASHDGVRRQISRISSPRPAELTWR
jgi:acyl-CoA hydrolase